MRWSSAASNAPRLEDALREATARVREGLAGATPDLLVAFVSPHHTAGWDTLPQRLHDALGARTLVGCSAGGVIGGRHELEEEPGLSLTAATLPGVRVRPVRLTEPAVPALADDPPAALVLLPDAFTFDVDECLRGIDAALPGCVTLGGLASGGRAPGGNILLETAAAHRAGAVGIALSGDVAVDTIVAQGCRPIGDPMFVTRSERNVIHELDGRRAAVVLQDIFARASQEDKTLFRSSLFLGVVMREDCQQYGHGDFLIRNVLGVDPRSASIVVGTAVRDAMVVQFHLRDARTSAEDLEALLARYHGQPAGALLFSCLGRGRGLYGRADHDTALFAERVGAVPLGGFFCNGEIGPIHGTTFLHGYTSAFGLFRPRGRPVS
ncbi:MAG: FIST C-terminal domain-containing protein [bacterium]|nr:FIST C-terminal domain-containing protein [bacterium]